LVILISLCFVPAVQKAVVLRALSGQVDSLEIKRLSVGLSAAHIEGLSLKKDGTSLAFESADVSYALSDVLFHKKVLLPRVALKKLALDLSAYKAPAETPAVPAAKSVPGEKKTSFEPLDGWSFAVGELSADAHIVLPGTVGTLDAVLTGASVGTAQTGASALTLTFAGTSNGIPVRTVLQTHTDITLSTASLPVKLRLQGSVRDELSKRFPSALSFSANIDEVSPGLHEFNATVADATAELLSLKGSFDEAAQRLQTAFSVSVKNGQIAPFLSGLPVPSIDANASGNLSYVIPTGATTAQTTLSARVWDLGKVDARLASISTLRLAASTDVGFLNGTVEMRALRADLYGPNDAHWLEARAMQVFRCDVKDPKTLANVTGEWVRVKVTDFPVALANPFLATSGLAVKGGAFSGELSFASQDKAVRVSNLAPVTLADFSLLQGKDTLLQSVALQANLNAVYKEDAMAFGYGVAAGAPVGALLTASGSGSYALKTAAFTLKGEATAFMPVIAQQPGVAVKLPPGLTIPYTLKAAYDLSGNADALNVNRLDCTGMLGKDTPLSFQLLKPLSYALKGTGMAALRLPTGDVLHVSADRLNLVIIQPLLEKGYMIESGNLSADLTVNYQKLAISLNAQKPLVLSDFSFSINGQPQARHLNVSLTPKVLLSLQSLIDFNHIQIAQGGVSTPALTGDVSLMLNGKDLASASLTASANLPVLFSAVPALSSINNVSSGTANLSANLDDSGKFNATAVISKLKAKFGDSAGSGIEGLSATVSGQYSDKPSVSLSGPLTILGASGTTQVTLGVQWEKTSSTAQRFALSLSGDTLHAADLALIGAAFNPPTQNPYLTAQPAAQSAPAAQTADTSAFWGDLTGSVRLNLKAITYNTFRLDQPAASVDISPTALKVSTLSARLDGFPLGLSGQLLFEAKNANPYSLSASAQITQVDMGKLLTTSTNSKPILEGTFSAQAALLGRGLNAENLVENLQGSLSAQSNQGVLHLMSASSNQAVQLIGGLASVFNTALGGIDSRIPMLSPLIDLLSALHYDQFSLKINRGANLNIVFSEMFIRGKEAMIAGKGQVTYQKGVPILSQPLNMEAQLYLRGGMVSDLKNFALFDSTATSEGYYPGPAFQIKGSLSSPDTSGLKDTLLRGITKIGSDTVAVPAGTTGTTSTTTSTASGTATSSGTVKEGERIIQNMLKGLF